MKILSNLKKTLVGVRSLRHYKCVEESWCVEGDGKQITEIVNTSEGNKYK